MSKVSVIVPIYNAENSIDHCIKSILKQTFKDFELLLVNDGSTDGSLNKCLDFKKKDQRITVINKPNEGCVLARRKGIESSNSKYIMFVDADDWIDKNTVEKLYKETIHHRLDIAVCNIYRIIGKGYLIKQKNKSMYFNENKIYQNVEIKNKLIEAYFHGHPFPPSLCAKLYRKEILINSGEYVNRVKFLGEDLYYNLEMLLKVERLKIIDKPLYYYRFGVGNTSKYMPYLFDDVINGYKIQKEVIENHFQDSKQHQYNGISIMLLNTFRTCLYNLFRGEYDEPKIKEIIREYASEPSVIESLNNEGAIRYFPEEYLNVIKNKDIDFLFRLGKSIYNKKKPKRVLMKIASQVL